MAVLLVELLALVAQVVVALVLHHPQLQHQALQTQVVAAAVVGMLVHMVKLVLVVQASSSFHTQAQHNYLVVALLANQAVTSFTHLHLLAHLALCHL